MESIEIVILCIGVVAYYAFVVYQRSSSRKGEIGELHVREELSKLPSEYVVLNDVVLKTKRGTTQIDHIVVSPYALFGIETKNYIGEIYGDDRREKWTQVIVTDVSYLKKWWKTYTYVTKNQFYNPVKQSLGHVLTLKDNLSEFGNVPMIPVVVFAGSAVLSNVKTKYPVVYIENLVPQIQSFEKRYLTGEQVLSMVSKIKGLDVRDTLGNREHVRNIQMAALARDAKVAEGVCPRCGGKLVLRQGKYGSFYGCTNYPKCRYTSGGKVL